jgi:hypothetical protein
MRSHGVSGFPDPTVKVNGNSVQVGIHITPALLTAGKACASVTHGQITPAQVVQAINGPH